MADHTVPAPGEEAGRLRLRPGDRVSAIAPVFMRPVDFSLLGGWLEVEWRRHPRCGCGELAPVERGDGRRLCRRCHLAANGGRNLDAPADSSCRAPK